MSVESERANFSKEHFNIIEIDVPRCLNTYGVGNCFAGRNQVVVDAVSVDDFNVGDVINGDTSGAQGTILSISGTTPNYTFIYRRTAAPSFSDNENISNATATGAATANGASVLLAGDDNNCYNTFATCQDLANYDDTDTIYTYRFCEPRSPHPQNLNNVAPCVESVSIAPAKINPKGGIGGRASLSVAFNDFPSSDRNDIDPYLSVRSYDPYSFGTFWTRWRTRNANYENYVMRSLSGYLVNGIYDANNFETRTYVLASMTASGGAASITAKDPLQLVSNKKSLAPKPSNGTLLASITNSATSATLTPSGIGNSEYPASGSLKIQDEVMTFTRSADALTLTRGQNNTTAAAHDAGDTVQLCLVYSGQPVDEVQEDLLTTYAGIDAAYIDSSQWAAEVSTYLTANPSTTITDPTSVNKLVDELCEQWPHKIFWNERAGKIKLEAIKAPPSTANALDMSDEILADSFTVKDKGDLQISTVLVRYGQYNPTKPLKEKENYPLSYARFNADAVTRYGSNQTKVINSRWIPSGGGGTARQLAALIGRRFGITPRECNFSLSDKDGSLWIAEKRAINHRDIVDQNGYPVDTIFEILSAKESNSYQYTGLEYVYDDELAEDEGGGEAGVDLVLIELDDQNVNLRTLYDAIFSTPTAATAAKFVIDNGVVVGSSSTATIGLDTGAWPAGATVTLQLNSGSFAVGCGGTGGDDANSYAGQVGGDAIILNHDLTLINNGVIGGGGGGGGGETKTQYGSTAKAAGGGGAGDSVGGRGADSFSGSNLITFNASEDGTTESGGRGSGITWGSGEIAVASGGYGGNLGQAGMGSGLGGVGGNGGAAGAAIDKNGYTLTETTTGDIRGSILT